MIKLTIQLHSFVLGYLDPGTGTALINIVIAGGVAIIYGLKSFFLRLFRRKPEGEENNSTKEDFQNISIFSEGKMYWNSYKDIINELINSKTKFSYYTLDVEDPALLIDSNYMNSKFLGY